MTSPSMSVYLVEKEESGEIRNRLTKLGAPELKEGDVLIEVEYSSLNYKDAMAATGHPGIVKTFPHVPGIDAVGTVIQSQHAEYQEGDQVIATGHEFGVERWGGWSTHLVCPGNWLVPLPDGLTATECMTLGTAGFTAAQCVDAIINNGCSPQDGPLIVSGATGGVGVLSVMLLAQLGFEVTAVTGKASKHDWLQARGAKRVVGREELASDAKRPLLKAEYAAGVDTVGGGVLATMLKKIQHRGCISCCGVAGGADLPTTVYPFILRGVSLNGIDSAWCPDDRRSIIWNKLATDWKLSNLDEVKVDLSLTTISAAVQQILAGEFAGRGVIRVTE